MIQLYYADYNMALFEEMKIAVDVAHPLSHMLFLHELAHIKLKHTAEWVPFLECLQMEIDAWTLAKELCKGEWDSGFVWECIGCHLVIEWNKGESHVRRRNNC